MFSEYLGTFLTGLLVSTGIGLIIGLEREFEDREIRRHYAGIRTFPITAILGFLIMTLASSLSIWLVVSTTVAFFIFIGLVYIVKSWREVHGFTTELSLLATFLLGIMAAQGLFREALAATVIITALLSSQSFLRETIERVTQEEIFAFIKFIMLALLILPFLPDQRVGPVTILNPRTIGWSVVLVSGIGFIGYLVMKFSGSRRSILVVALIGALVSSTAVTWVYARRSKDNPEHRLQYAAGIVLASLVMVIRIGILVAVFNRNLLIYLWPAFGALLITQLLATYWIWKKHTPDLETQGNEVKLGNPLEITEAFFFAFVLVAIALIVHYADTWFGTAGLYLAGLLSGLTDVDAISINMARFAAEKQAPHLAITIMLLAVLSNTAVKGGIAYWRGHPAIRRFMVIAFGAFFLVDILLILWHAYLA